MNGVENNFLIDNFNVQVKVIECLCHCFQLSHRIVGETSPFAPVMELQPVRSFIVAKIGRCFDPRI